MTIAQFKIRSAEFSKLGTISEIINILYETINLRSLKCKSIIECFSLINGRKKAGV